MKDISSLLGRIQKSLGKSTYLKEGIISVIEEKTGARLSVDDVVYKEGVLEIKASPGLKNTLRMKEDAFKNAVQQQTGSVVSRILYK